MQTTTRQKTTLRLGLAAGICALLPIGFGATAQKTTTLTGTAIANALATHDTGLASSSNTTVQKNARLSAVSTVVISGVVHRSVKARLDVTANSTADGADQMICTTFGARKNVIVPMTFDPTVLTYSCTIIGDGSDATAVKVSSSAGGSAAVTNKNPIWKLR
jgi:hypothetical protein